MGGSELHRDFHSTPDLAHNAVLSGAADFRVPKGHRSQEDVASLLLSGGVVTGRPPLPPPTHPPPPPPVGQLVKVDVSRGTLKPNSSSGAEYANMTHTTKVEVTTANLTPDGSVMSSFRPANSAKLYASPEDVRMVGYRSRSLPAHSARPQVRKSHSLRASASSFKPTQMSTTNSNPYAQPFRTASARESLKLKNKKKKGIPTSSSAANLSNTGGPPPIPEPDYSLSESEGEAESEGERPPRPAETSGSSSSSGTLPHSFSVEEIQKVRTQLKSSKSYPNDFLVMNPTTGEDGDNSSSGVSSDQDVPVGPPSGFDEGSEEKELHKTSSLPPRHGVLTRNAVSLAQLPPPMEGDGEGEGELVVPPPPEFLGGIPGAAEEVLAPPPQFSDNRLVTRVRIVGAVPKTANASSRLHSQ